MWVEFRCAGLRQEAGLREVWMPHPDDDGYEISNWGRVRTWKIKNSKKRRDIPQQMALHFDRHGYVYTHLCFNGKNKNCKIHRLVMLAFHGPSDRQVNHINFDRKDNRLPNLEYVTVTENHRHTAKHGRWTECRGLSADQIKEIVNGKESNQYYADKFGFHKETIRRNRNGMTFLSKQIIEETDKLPVSAPHKSQRS